MSRRPLDPRICNVAIDANALSTPDATRAAAVNRLLALHDSRGINLIVPQGVRRELQHPLTPTAVREAGMAQIFTIRTGLSDQERKLHQAIEDELQGNANPGKHVADADHLFEANKYCEYFITHDRRILDRAGKLRSFLSPALNVVTLDEFLAIYDDFEAGRRH